MLNSTTLQNAIKAKLITDGFVFTGAGGNMTEKFINTLSKEIIDHFIANTDVTVAGIVLGNQTVQGTIK